MWVSGIDLVGANSILGPVFVCFFPLLCRACFMPDNNNNNIIMYLSCCLLEFDPWEKESIVTAFLEASGSWGGGNRLSLCFWTDVSMKWRTLGV